MTGLALICRGVARTCRAAAKDLDDLARELDGGSEANAAALVARLLRVLPLAVEGLQIALVEIRKPREAS